MRPTILHLDIDAFFASVEQLKNPKLRGRPVIVGAGVVATCSYEARRLGVRVEMPIRLALRICPQAVVVEGDQRTYAAFAEQVWSIMRRWIPEVETYLDEAYGDLTGTEGIYDHPLTVGRGLRRQVREEVGLNVTIGIASNRMIAKMAGKTVKPDGLAFVPWGGEEAFVADRPVDDLLGVGPVTDRMLAQMNLRKVRDLWPLSPDLLYAMLGKNGLTLYERCRGKDSRPSRHGRPLPRTISRETSLHRPTCDAPTVRAYLQYLAERGMRTIRRSELETRAVGVRIRYEDDRWEETSRTLPRPTSIDEEVLSVIRELFGRIFTRRVNLTHFGVVFSQFRAADPQGDLFEAPRNDRLKRLHDALDEIRDKFGHSSILAGGSIALLNDVKRGANGFILRTPSLTK